MTRDFLMATIAALGLTACGPDLTTEIRSPSNARAAPAQPAEADKPDAAVAQAGPPAGLPTQAASENQTAAGDSKDDDKKEDGEKKPL